MRTRARTSLLTACAALLAPVALLGTSLASPDPDDDDRVDSPRIDFFELAPAKMIAPMTAEMGATPGGAQDIDFARDRIEAGQVPHPDTFTPEGLFSQHDLPLETGRPCEQILCLSGAAAPVDLIAQPEARLLAQLGFASNLDPATWRRPPLNLIAVIDKSGSMGGAPLETVKASLRQVVDQLGASDQLAIVLYGDRSYVHLRPTPMSRKADARRAIDAIRSAGSTYMEAGLAVGFRLARQTQPAFAGRTRVMLFTDERPNVGNTDRSGFMGMARAASAGGIGLTTVGVGTHFGADLATAISSVRGGNLFFFPDPAAMKEKLSRDLDTLVTELAYDLKLRVVPRAGWTLVGLYGLPGERVRRTPDGGLEMTVETLFLSRERGGIYFAFAPEAQGLPPAPGSVAVAMVSYLGVDGQGHEDQVELEPWTQSPLPLGLARGRLLVDEITTLKKAAGLHLQGNDQEGAYRLVHALRVRLRQSRVPGLAGELKMVARLDETLARLSGHQGEPSTEYVRRDAVSGLPLAR